MSKVMTVQTGYANRAPKVQRADRVDEIAETFNLPTLLALAVIVAATVACGSDTTPADDVPSSRETQVGSQPLGDCDAVE